MRVESERLWFAPIGDGEIRALIDAEADEELRRAYGQMLEGCLREPEARLWYAVWLMRSKEQPGRVVGDFCFKGPPADGMVELGYGLREGCCGRGYMTETVLAMVQWALAQPGVTRVEAETEPENRASQRVLARAGFRPAETFGEEGPRFVLTRGQLGDGQ